MIITRTFDRGLSSGAVFSSFLRNLRDKRLVAGADLFGVIPDGGFEGILTMVISGYGGGGWSKKQFFLVERDGKYIKYRLF